MAHNHDHEGQIPLTIICLISLLLGAVAEYTSILPETLAIWFYVAAYLSGGYHGFIETIEHLRKLELNIDFLMIAAALGAAILGEWIEGAILLFLFSLSGALESYALGKSRNAIHSLLKLRPSQGLRLKPDGTEELVSIEQLRIGDMVLVKPGEHIPIDGNIIKGQTTIDQSAITGESIPVSKEIGDAVFAATLNENGVIELKVTKPAKDTTVAKIIELVESAQKNRAKTQRLLDTFEPRYAISVVVAVIGLIFIPWLVFGHEFDSTFYRAMTVLVVASPCALIISTPASIISAIANGAKNGVLFKGGAYVEQAVEIDTIAFDKTGTLTKGKPEVTHTVVFDSISDQFIDDAEEEKKMLSVAAGCEQYSEHHLAEAIINYSKTKGAEPVKVENMTATPGQGVFAEISGRQVAVGNQKMFTERFDYWSKKIHQRAEELRKQGNTVVFVAVEGKPIGMIALADKIRPQARDTIAKLRGMGVKKIVMLTGDNPDVAKAIASDLGMDEVHADLLPEQKVDVINKLKSTGTVAMVGDGVNDAPALALSNLGIAMGAAGTDVALETADVVLMGDDLEKIPYMLRLSRKAKKVVWQNITFSLGVIVMLLAGVFLIDLPLTAGVIGHEGSTLLVVLNGLRLLRKSE
ncbi:MAG: cadmium-translocating P-type ATPase [Balneolaceae bacterium]|nr:MAG: cadmium-translocating P-type ATPase [Balneolaceae bacterium]